eukprot:12576184-Alexandrium_andersonii.AAC.1
MAAGRMNVRAQCAACRADTSGCERILVSPLQMIGVHSQIRFCGYCGQSERLACLQVCSSSSPPCR